jgi:hypothetical protein
MLRKQSLTPADRWLPVYTLWIDFTKNNRQLALSDSSAAMRRFLMIHADALQSAGVITKASGKHWLADVERFEEVAFLACIGKLEAAA